MNIDELVTTQEEIVIGMSRQAKARIKFVVDTIEYVRKMERHSDLSEFQRMIHGISTKAYSHIKRAGTFEELIRTIDTDMPEIYGNREVARLIAIGTEGGSVQGKITNWTGLIAEIEFFFRLFTGAIDNQGQMNVYFSNGNSVSGDIDEIAETFEEFINILMMRPAQYKAVPKVGSIVYNSRRLFANKTPSWSNRNNIDIIVQRTTSSEILKNRCHLFGEIKGGYDPAGADEHWKTATRSLSRIRNLEQGENWKYFFVGRCIAEKMAHEIISMFSNDHLHFAMKLDDTTIEKWQNLFDLMFFS